MRDWSRKDESLLRQARKQRLKTYPSEVRKDAKKAPKPESETGRLIKAGGGLFLLSVIFPAIVVVMMQEWFDLAVFFEVLPLVLYPLAGIAAVSIQQALTQGPEFFFSLLLPYPLERALQAGFKRMGYYVLFWGWMIFLVLVLTGVNVFPGKHVLPMGLMHSAAFIITVFFILKIKPAGLIPWFWVGPLALGLGRLCLPDKLVAVEKFTNLAGLIFPNGWVNQAYTYWMAGNVLPAIICLGLLLPTFLFAIQWIPEERLRISADYISLEWAEQADDLDDWDLDLVEAPETLEESTQRFSHNLILKVLPKEMPDFMVLLRGGAPIKLLSGKFVNAMAVLGFALCFLIPAFPVSPLFFIAYGCLIVPCLISTPFLGGGWKSIPDGYHDPQLLPIMAVYPVSLSYIYRSALRVNALACLFAFPYWILAGFGIGFSIMSIAKGLQLLLGLWIICCALQSFAVLCSLTQTGVSLAKGKVWRGMIAIIAVLVWVLCLLGSVVFLVMSLKHPDFLIYWGLLLGLGVFVYGWIVAKLLIRAYEGTAYDMICGSAASATWR